MALSDASSGSEVPPGYIPMTILPVTVASLELTILMIGEVRVTGLSLGLLFVGGVTVHVDGYVNDKFKSLPFEVYWTMLLGVAVPATCGVELDDCCVLDPVDAEGALFLVINQYPATPPARSRIIIDVRTT